MLEQLTYQARFAEMLAGSDEAVTPWLADATHIARLRVYRNNVVTAWADMIVKNYPAVERLVGTDFMRGAAIAFVKKNPPQSPVLSTYGEGFPAFIQEFEPARGLPYLADVARLDRAWTEAFFAPPTAPLGPGNLAGKSEVEVGALVLGLHPSVWLFSSKWNAREIWNANRSESDAPKIALEERPTWAAVWWSPNGMADRALESTEYQFLELISGGAPLGDALTKASSKVGESALYQFFSEALAGGLLTNPHK